MTGLADTFVADHLQYHASLALIAISAAAIVLAIRRISPAGTALLILAGFTVLAPLAVVAERRTHVFHDRAALDNKTVLQNRTAWMAYYDLASSHRENGNLDLAIQAQGRAIDVLGGRQHANPANGDLADNLAGCYEKLAALYVQAGKSADAIIAHDQSIAIREELVRQQPDVPAYRDHLAWSYTDRAASERDPKKAVEALEWYRKSVAQQEAVVKTFPARYSTQNNLATNYVDIGIIELDENLGVEAAASFAKARDIRQRLVEEFPHGRYFATASPGATSTSRWSRPGSCIQKMPCGCLPRP